MALLMSAAAFGHERGSLRCPFLALLERIHPTLVEQIGNGLDVPKDRAAATELPMALCNQKTIVDVSIALEMALLAPKLSGSLRRGQPRGLSC